MVVSLQDIRPEIIGDRRDATALGDVVVVSSPLQYMNAVEWRRTRSERIADLVLLDDRAGGSDAVDRLLARAPGLWDSVIRHPRRPKARRWASAIVSDLADALHRASLRRVSARMAPGGCSTLVFGDFRNLSQRELVARIPYDRLVLLDDGSITPQAVRWRAGLAVPDPRRFADRWFRTAVARSLFGDSPAVSPEAMTFFTIYASLVEPTAARADKVEQHAFESWRSGDVVRRGDEVWLLGSNHVTARIADADVYRRVISGGVAALRDAGMGGPIVYRPHRDEDRMAAITLADALGMRLAASSAPAELAYIDAELKPAAVAVVASSAADTLSVIDPGLALFRLQLPPDYLLRQEGHIRAVISVHDAFIPHLRVLTPNDAFASHLKT